jgi:hypothetical protein
MKTNCKIIYKFDLFGKLIGLFYKGSEKRNTYFGSIFSLVFLITIFLYFIYKMMRFINRDDVIFYDTFEYYENPPLIQLTKDNFYGGFALENPLTYDPFIDETIYYPKAFFKKGIRKGDKWNFDIKEMELERCKIEKYGKAFQDTMVHNALNNLYCFKEINEILEGHFSYNIYSFLYIQFFPCVNSSENNNHCKSIETIDFYLNNSFICFEMEDIELTPQNYTYQMRGRKQDIYFKISKKLFQEVHIFYQLINVETDLDFFGFNKLKRMNNKQYLKYYTQIQMSTIIDNDIYITGEAFCAVTIKLHDEIRIQKRTYTTIIEVLGNVGGFMEFLFLLFKVICHFSGKILFELSLVNNLFQFDLDKKLINVRNKNKRIYFKDIKINNNKKWSVQLKPECISNYKRSDISNNRCLSIFSIEPKYKINNVDKSSFLAIKKNQNLPLFNFSNKKNNELKKFNNICSTKNENKIYIINNIHFNRLYICMFFCFIRKRKNLQNILLNEGMRIIMEKMDILYLFKRIMNKEKEPQKIEILKMSDKCKAKIKSINE